MSYRAELRCTAGCGGSFPVDDAIYSCPSCGGLLDVRHDVDALRDRSPTEWKELFDSRYRRGRGALASPVWGKKEWVMPCLRDEDIVSLGEGGTHLLKAVRYGQQLGLDDVWVKQCGTSHTGSFKDLGMTVLVSVVKRMVSDGKRVRAIACASTGDTSAALAAYAAAAGLRAVVLLPRGMVSTAQLVQPLSHGALVLALATDFDGCMAIVKRLANEYGLYLANSMNPLRIEGQKTVAIEMVQQLDWEVPDWVVIPGGNLGNVSALGSGFDLLVELGLVTKRPRICVAQAEAANPLYRAYAAGDWKRFASITAQPTLASAIRIGNPVSVARAIRVLERYDGVVEHASETELADAAARADATGLYTCPHTGVALAALEKLARRGQITRHQPVVVVSTASGLKFTDFKVDYHEGRQPGIDAALRNQPLELAASYDEVRRALDRRLH